MKTWTWQNINMDSTHKEAGCALRGRRNGRFGEPSLPARIAILLVKAYQKVLSPWLGPRCRFHPSCSHYCIEALQQHGMVLGLWLVFKRICKCHPFHPGGVDPVPDKKKAHSAGNFTTEDSENTEGSNLTSVTSTEAGGINNLKEKCYE